MSPCILKPAGGGHQMDAACWCGYHVPLWISLTNGCCPGCPNPLVVVFLRTAVPVGAALMSPCILKSAGVGHQIAAAGWYRYQVPPWISLADGHCPGCPNPLVLVLLRTPARWCGSDVAMYTRTRLWWPSNGCCLLIRVSRTSVDLARQWPRSWSICNCKLHTEQEDHEHEQ